MTSEKNTPKTFSHMIRVYIEDTDAGGLMYHTNHIKFMERGRTEALRECGFTKVTMDEKYGLYFVVKTVEIDYKSPAYMDDLLEVQTTLLSVSKARMYFLQGIYRSQTLIASAKLTIVCINKDFRPEALPQEIFDKISGASL